MTDLNRSLTGFRYVQIEQGDTLQAIAARELKDASRWPDLIIINGLVYPYLTGDATKAGASVKLYGDLIAVPAASVQVNSSVDPNAVFGIDVALTKGDLSAVGGDFALISGRENYKQAISNRVSTNKAELLFHLDYGCDVRRLLGAVNGPTAELLAAEYVKASLLSDNRTQSVPSVNVSVVGDTLSTNATVVPVTGAVIEISTGL